MKAIVFGINGQDGFYLSRLLKEKNIEVIGISRNGNFVKGNVADYNFVEEQIKLHKPSYVFHLAANSTTQHYALFENHETISTGTLNILESVYKFSPDTKVFLSGSAMQFKNEGLPINEKSAFDASSPYSIARIQSVYAARYYRKLGVKAYVGYLFNHDSPLRTEQHVTQKIALTTKRIAAGSKEILEIGDISVKKEYNFAGDMAEAMWRLVKNDTIFEAVMGSGKAYSIEDWLTICFTLYKLNWKDFVKTKSDFKAEYKILISDPALLLSLGWKPKVDIKQLAELMLNSSI